jgi:ribosome-associated protein
MKLKTSKLELPPLLKQICQALDDKKAEDIRVLRVSAQSSITDYLVLGTGTSEPHLRALRVEIEKIIDQSGVRILGMDTGQGSGWMVVDAFDIMVHVFTPENRRKYALESLWKDAEELSLSTGEVVAKAPTTKKRSIAKPAAKPRAKAKTKPKSIAGAKKKPTKAKKKK